MRLFPILTALLVVAGLFMLVFQRDTLDEAAGVADTSDIAAETETEAGADDQTGLSVVVLKSTAREIETPIVIRGRTEATRRVELRAETSGQVVSDKLAKGSTVAKGDVMCRLDPGTRDASLAEAKARLAEAKARAPEAEARVIEAQARLDEATINLTAAEKLSEVDLHRTPVWPMPAQASKPHAQVSFQPGRVPPAPMQRSSPPVPLSPGPSARLNALKFARHLRANWKPTPPTSERCCNRARCASHWYNTIPYVWWALYPSFWLINFPQSLLQMYVWPRVVHCRVR